MVMTTVTVHSDYATSASPRETLVEVPLSTVLRHLAQAQKYILRTTGDKDGFTHSNIY